MGGVGGRSGLRRQMQALDMLGMVAMLFGSDSVTVAGVLHLAISAVSGGVHGAAVAARVGGWGTGLGSGLAYGATLWVVGPLVLMPVKLGMSLCTVNTMAVQSLFGRLMSGWCSPPPSSGSRTGRGNDLDRTCGGARCHDLLAVTAPAISSGGAIALVSTYLAYAAGMGAVGTLALASAMVSDGMAARMRRTGPYVARCSGALLVLAGTYVTWYGWFELRVLAGTAPGDPVVEAATHVQARVARAVAGVGAPGLAAVAPAVAARVCRTRRNRHVDRVREHRLAVLSTCTVLVPAASSSSPVLTASSAAVPGLAGLSG